MAEPFIAEIRIFAGNFAPRGWAFCDGQLLPIAENTALFSLVGTTYGGDGRDTLALPNMDGRAPMHPGHGAGLSSRRLGQKVGTYSVTLTEAQMPNHRHTLRGAAAYGVTETPTDQTSIASSFPAPFYSSSDVNLIDMAFESLEAVGGYNAHENRQPSLSLNFIIALIGLYPSGAKDPWGIPLMDWPHARPNDRRLERWHSTRAFRTRISRPFRPLRPISACSLPW